MVLDREAPGSHWLGLARNDLEFAYLKLRVHMMNSIVVLSPFWVKHDLQGGSVLVFLNPPDPPRTIPRRMPEYLRVGVQFFCHFVLLVALGCVTLLGNGNAPGRR